MMGFKEIVKSDNEKIFLNPNEFGEEHDVMGRQMNIIIDDIEQIEREKRQSGSQAYRQGVYKRQLLIYVKASEFGKLPATGRILILDGKNYIITDAVDEDGIFSISLEAQKQ